MYLNYKLLLPQWVWRGSYSNLPVLTGVVWIITRKQVKKGKNNFEQTSIILISWDRRRKTVMFDKFYRWFLLKLLIQVTIINFFSFVDTWQRLLTLARHTCGGGLSLKRTTCLSSILKNRLLREFQRRTLHFQENKLESINFPFRQSVCTRTGATAIAGWIASQFSNQKEKLKNQVKNHYLCSLFFYFFLSSVREACDYCAMRRTECSLWLLCLRQYKSRL